VKHLKTAASVLATALCAVVVLSAQNPPASTPPPQQQQQPQTPQQPTPTFRGEVNVIRLDVSVLDKERRPVRGLTGEDFRVEEDGKPQRIVAVSEIDAAEFDPAPSAWMRHVTRDIATNDLNDQVGDGRVFAIVMDDVNIPWDDMDIIMSARNIGRYIIDGLGPSDIAAVVYPRDAGITEDFTSDRSKLLKAVESFDPREPDMFMIRRQDMPGQGGGDMPYRASPALMRSDCERMQPTVPTLNVLTSRLATIPNRRKTIIMVSVGIPLNFAARDDCGSRLADAMRDTFRIAQRANVNLYSVDPAGFQGYERYLQKPIRRGGRPAPSTMSQGAAQSAARLRRDFLEITADYTGARAVVGNESAEAGIDRIFSEDGSYYLVGYQSSNGAPDGKFRRVNVKVNKSGLTVRTRSGYFAPKPGQVATPEDKAMPTTNDLGLSGLGAPVGLPLRTSVTPIGLANTASGKDVNVAIVLSARLPASGGNVSELLTVTRNIYDADGRASAPAQEKIPITLPASDGDGLRYDIYQSLVLAPGRYQVRLNAHSKVLNRSSSVFADIEVPDLTRPAVSMTAIALGVQTSPAAPRTDALSALLPIVPTSSRDFSPSDAINAFCRVYQGGTAAPVAATMKVMVLDVNSQVVLDTSQTIAAEAFGEGRFAPFQLQLPLNKMKHGPHVLSLHATLPGGANIRKDVVFRVR
jgi:VWFA-related protein